MCYYLKVRYLKFLKKELTKYLPARGVNQLEADLSNERERRKGRNLV